MTTASRSRKSSSTKPHASTKPTPKEPAPLEAKVVSAPAGGATSAPTTQPPVAAAAPLSIAPPPPIASVPTPPPGFVPTGSGDYRGILPRSSELLVLSSAIADLGKLTNYSIFIGAPPQASLLEMLTVAGQWTTMRNASAAWDAYAAAQEGSAWSALRVELDRLKPGFDLAAAADKNLGAQNPGLVQLLGARSAISLKGATTRKANKQAIAKGERPAHGAVGKQRQRAAAKAALAAADAATTADSAKPSTPEAPPAANGTATNGATPTGH